MKKKFFLIGFIILVLVAIPATVFLVRQQQELRSRAAPATTVSFSPQAKTVQVNETFTVSTLMDTGVNSVATAEIHITFDASKLEATKVEPGPTGSLMQHALITPTPNNIAGTAFIAVDTLQAGASSTDVPFTKKSTGAQAVAVFTFKAKAGTPTPTEIKFSPETKAFGETSGTLEPTNLILSSSLANIARITVQAAAVTPTPTGGATPTPTRSLTPTPTGGVSQTQNKAPVCNSLTAAPATGIAPLTVTLTANASDQNNDIVSAAFTFGDGQTQNVDKNIGQSGSIQTTHVYQTAGTISAQATVKDRDGATSTACITSITASLTTGQGTGGIATPTAVPQIPVTGDISPTLIFSVAGAALVILGTILFFAL